MLKFRLHLFEPPDLSRPDAAGVVHYEPPERQYQAAYELAFRNHLDMERFFASPEYAAAVRDEPRFVQQVSPFPERTAYTFVYDGRMTLAGRARFADGRADHPARRHQPAPGRHPRPRRRRSGSQHAGGGEQGEPGSRQDQARSRTWPRSTRPPGDWSLRSVTRSVRGKFRCLKQNPSRSTCEQGEVPAS